MDAEASFVLVCKTGPQSRSRLAINLELPDGADCGAFSDAQCRELFQHVQGVDGGVN
jgi:hypothetical protein